MEEQNKKTETTLDDVLTTINEFAQKTEDRFSGLEVRLEKMNSEMATKDFVTEKLADLQGNLTVLMRKEDTKLKALVEILEAKQIITAEDKKHILAMEPFPSLM